MARMISLLRGRARDDDGASAETTAMSRVDRRTKSLTKRLGGGADAVIAHIDIHRVSAEALVACAPAAVLSAAFATAGRYPNLDPQILVEARTPLVDDLGSDVMGITE